MDVYYILMLIIATLSLIVALAGLVIKLVKHRNENNRPPR